MAGEDRPKTFVDSRRTGEAIVSVINDGSLLWNPGFPVSEEEFRAAAPDADDLGRVRPECHACLIQLGDARILIDPGMDDPESAWQQRFEESWDGASRTPGLRVGLSFLGVEPSDITHLVLTHTHFDHVGGLTVEQEGRLFPRFPNARHYLGRAEWDDSPAREEPGTDMHDRVGLIVREGLAEFVDERVEVVPGLEMLSAPGESPGHCMVRLESKGSVFMYVGDLFHHASEVDNIDWVPRMRDVEATVASRRRFYDEAVKSSATVVATHEKFPAWGRIERSGDGFRWVRG